MQNMTQESTQEVNADPSELFKPAAWLAKIDFINHLVLFKNALITVVAEEGGGKTTFIELLQSGLDSQIKSHVVTATPLFTPTGFLEELAKTFHLSIDNEFNIHNLIQQINERKTHTLIVIDDAHYASESFLNEVLLELGQEGEQTFFHLCLVSDFSIMANLNKLEATPFGSLIQILEPGALTENETKTYLLKALPAPKRLDKTMSDKRLEQFYQLTGGNIARINKEMLHYFCSEALKVPSTRNSHLAKYLSLTATFVVAVLAGIFVWQNQDRFRHVEPVTAATLEKAKQIGGLASHLASIISMPSGDQEALISEIPAYDNDRTASYIAPFNLSAMIQAVQPPPLKRVVDIVLDEDEQENNSLVLMDKVVVIPKTISNPHARKVADLERNVLSARELPKPISAPAFSKDAPAVVASAIPVERKVTAGGQYTVQLVASQRLEDIQRFMRLHHLSENTKIRKTKHQGHDWFVLTLGEYSGFTQAQQAANSLPASLSQFKPWIRSMTDLNAVG
ncbi:DamX-like protein [Legionella lansingensis]|uniref:DamX-related protein n=1 Tax=Legionella lansingensis TaxID=45067 RepID=A0A0W0VXX0_9GAMM|nr:AAA family ATPase [Legionella lansingensis]KTD24802.1 DamX-related protein [Legionella lansingensis]SNV49015.1 DamX-like protein [Legionella lansingensis]